MCLSDSVQRAENVSSPIFDLYPFWPTEKAASNERKPKVLKQPIVKDRSDDRSCNNTKETNDIMVLKVHIRDRPVFVLA